MTEQNQTPEIAVEDSADDAEGHFIKADDTTDTDDTGGHFIKADDTTDTDDTGGHFIRK
jgi:hypothetical protein